MAKLLPLKASRNQCLLETDSQVTVKSISATVSETNYPCAALGYSILLKSAKLRLICAQDESAVKICQVLKEQEFHSI